jgi:hypothetical protein
MLALALALAGPPVIVAGGADLHAECDPAARVVARLDGGTAVRLGYSISGEHGRCFHVSAGKLEGFVFAQALMSIEDYERARSAASDSALPQMLRAETRRIRRETPAHPLLAPVLEALDAGRPAEALRRIESDLLPKMPDEAGLLALAGIAAYQADELSRAESYWARSVALRPDRQVAALLERLRAERAADSGQDRADSSRFVLRYEGRALSGGAAQALLAMLDEELARIDAAIGCPSAEPLTVIVQTREAYRAATGLGEWNGGLFDGRVRVPLPEGEPAAGLRRTLAHELVHACLARRGIRERWLHEGLAMRLSGEGVPAGLLREAEQLDRVPEWDGSSPQRAALFYAWAWLAVDRLFRTHGEAGVRQLLRNPRALPAPAIR